MLTQVFGSLAVILAMSLAGVAASPTSASDATGSKGCCSATKHCGDKECCEGCPDCECPHECCEHCEEGCGCQCG